MPDLHGPWDGASYGQGPWYRDGAFMPSGVLGPPAASSSTGDLALTAAGFVLSMALGRARVRGSSYERSGTAWTDTVPANASSVGPRIDRVVLRRDVVAKTTVPVRIQGTAAATPTPPALSRVENGAWDLPLYQVTVPPSSGTPLVITDERMWAQVDRTIGERFLSASAAFLLTGGWDTLTGGFPLTGVTDGGLVRARWSLTCWNGSSGADRTVDVRVICDGVQIGTGLTGMPIPLQGTVTPRIPRTQTDEHTPAAGLHTWYLQARASVASAVYVDTAHLAVVTQV